MRKRRRITRLTTRLDWDEMIRALMLVKVGQELGADTPLARAAHDFVELLLRAIS